jgi:L-asparaginase II
MPTATDGCGVVTFALTLRRAAAAFGRLPSLEAGPRVVAAIRRHPDLLRGPIGADTRAIRALDGWAAKGGAEGLFCACSPDGLGVALKVEDGAFRAVVPALAEVLRRLGLDGDAMGRSPVVSSRGDVVGEMRTV